MKIHAITGTNEPGATITEPTTHNFYPPSLSPYTTLYLVWKYIHQHSQTYVTIIHQSCIKEKYHMLSIVIAVLMNQNM